MMDVLVWCGVAALVALVSDNLCGVVRCGAVLTSGGMVCFCNVVRCCSVVWRCGVVCVGAVR